MDHIKTICVLPAADPQQRYDDLLKDLRNLANFIDQKTVEYEKVVQETSAVELMANVLANRTVCWEFADELTKLYDAFTTYRCEEFTRKLNDMKMSNETPKDIKDLLVKVSDLWERWDAFLERVDAELEKTIGPHSLNVLSDSRVGSEHADDNNREMRRNNPLKALIEHSAYEMTLISVVVSFENANCTQHAIRVYEHLAEFHEYGCDVLMLTRGNIGKGGGFLKIVGVPFRQLMNEQEACSRLLQYRQSAISLAGSKALYKFTEVICNDGAQFAIDEESGSTMLSVGRTILVDSDGEVLYSHIVDECGNWPDVGVLLQNVRNQALQQSHSSMHSLRSTQISSAEKTTSNAKPQMNNTNSSSRTNYHKIGATPAVPSCSERICCSML